MQSRTLPALLERSAARSGARECIRGPGGPEDRVSYEELAAWSARVRDRVALIAAPGDLVLLGGVNSIAWIAGFFGILRRGAIAVPVDPALPDELLIAAIDEIHPSAALGDDAFLARLPSGLPQYRLEEIEDAGTAPASVPDTPGEPDSLAVLLFTAGTMGQPKGVMLSHRNLISNVADVIDAAALRPGDSIFLILPLYHSFALTVGCLTAIAAGVPIELEHRVAHVRARLRATRPTLLLGVPALYELILREAERTAGGPRRRRLLAALISANAWLARHGGPNLGRILFRPLHQALGGRLRYAVSGGSALRSATQERAFALGLPLMQGYGLSEASPVVTFQRFDARRFWFSSFYWSRIGSLGPPLAHCRVRVDPVPGLPEGEGELLVAGPNVMLGYFRRAAETREALADGWLRTGDLGCVDRQGAVWITGRRKLAVSTPRGELVQLERIEAVLGAAPEVAQVRVIEEVAPEWRLLAVVFPARLAGEGGGSAEEIGRNVRSAIAARAATLSPHERIGAVRLIDRPLPVTPLGKLRREAPVPDQPFDADRWRRQLREAEGGAR